MRRQGQGNAEKVAACGALQRRRGEAPKAALRLSPTFAADNGQRANPHAASAKINATAEPHATARRMLLTSPSPRRRRTARAAKDSRRQKNSRRKRVGNSPKTKGAREGPEAGGARP